MPRVSCDDWPGKGLYKGFKKHTNHGGIFGLEMLKNPVISRNKRPLLTIMLPERMFVKMIRDGKKGLIRQALLPTPDVLDRGDSCGLFELAAEVGRAGDGVLPEL